MCCLTMGIHSEKCVSQFRHCTNIIKWTYTNLDDIAYCTPRLYGIPLSCRICGLLLTEMSCDAWLYMPLIEILLLLNMLFYVLIYLTYKSISSKGFIRQCNTCVWWYYKDGYYKKYYVIEYLQIQWGTGSLYYWRYRNNSSRILMYHLQ